MTSGGSKSETGRCILASRNSRGRKRRPHAEETGWDVFCGCRGRARENVASQSSARSPCNRRARCAATRREGRVVMADIAPSHPPPFVLWRWEKSWRTPPERRHGCCDAERMHAQPLNFPRLLDGSWLGSSGLSWADTAAVGALMMRRDFSQTNGAPSTLFLGEAASRQHGAWDGAWEKGPPGPPFIGRAPRLGA